MVEQAVDDRGAVEAGDDGGPAGDGGRLEPANLLHPSDVELNLWPGRGEGVEAVLLAPVQVAAQVGLGVGAGEALEPGEVAGDGQLQQAGFGHVGRKNLGRCHVSTVALFIFRPSNEVLRIPPGADGPVAGEG